jgi:hypothetical protein
MVRVMRSYVIGRRLLLRRLLEQDRAHLVDVAGSDPLGRLLAQLDKCRMPKVDGAELSDDNDPDGTVVLTNQGRPVAFMPREVYDHFRNES